MKKLFSMLTMVAMITCFGMMPAQATKIADFTVLDSFIETGESFDVEVSVFDDGTLGDLTAFGFDVDPLSSLTLFSFDSYAVGPDFDDVGMGSYVAGLNWFDMNEGTDVLLATLTFTAGATAGTDTLSIEGLFDDFSGLYYEFGDEDIGGDISISIAIDPIPEPSTILLMGAGLLGLLGYSRKRLNKKA